MAPSCDVSNCNKSTNDVSSVEIDHTTPHTLSSDIHRISQILDSIERQNYVLNLFDKMDDVDLDPEDYYGMMIEADAHADSLADSP